MAENDTSISPSGAGFDASRKHHWIAFGFGSGLAPYAPGSVGTLVAVPLVLVLSVLPLGLYVVAVLAAFAAGVWACGEAARDLGQEDPPAIVWDEIVGFMIAMTAVPTGLVWLVLAFVIFRLLDIFKPWPIRWVQERFQGGLGVMLDDVAAGLLTWVILQLLVMKVVASGGVPI